MNKCNVILNYNTYIHQRESLSSKRELVGFVVAICLVHLLGVPCGNLLLDLKEVSCNERVEDSIWI
jgi:hypothetical protein